MPKNKFNKKIRAAYSRGSDAYNRVYQGMDELLWMSFQTGMVEIYNYNNKTYSTKRMKCHIEKTVSVMDAMRWCVAMIIETTGQIKCKEMTEFFKKTGGKKYYDTRVKKTDKSYS